MKGLAYEVAIRLHNLALDALVLLRLPVAAEAAGGRFRGSGLAEDDAHKRLILFGHEILIGRRPAARARGLENLYLIVDDRPLGEKDGPVLSDRNSRLQPPLLLLVAVRFLELDPDGRRPEFLQIERPKANSGPFEEYRPIGPMRQPEAIEREIMARPGADRPELVRR